MIGVKQLARTERVERVGCFQRQTQRPRTETRRTRNPCSMRSTKTEAEAGGNCDSLLQNG